MSEKSELAQLLDDCRLEMGPKVFRQFADDLSGRSKPIERVRTMVCAICNGAGVNSIKPGPCEGCSGHGKF